jgi:hypothetical protein
MRTSARAYGSRRDPAASRDARSSSDSGVFAGYRGAPAFRGGCCINHPQAGLVGGGRTNPAHERLSSHFAWRMAAFVWRRPTTFELCNSHRE